MSLSAESYARRAEDCVRLANLTADQIVQADILKLRQNPLQRQKGLVAAKRSDRSRPEVTT